VREDDREREGRQVRGEPLGYGLTWSECVVDTERERIDMERNSGA